MRTNRAPAENAPSFCQRARRGMVHASAVCLILSPAWSDATQSDLVVRVGGFTHERGQAIARMFCEGDDIFATPSARRITALIHQGKVTLVFPNVKPGNYAVIVFHDENGNNDLDHNLFRLPAEPLGFSGGFRLSLFSGMPSFKKLRFAFAVDAQPLEISVR